MESKYVEAIKAGVIAGVLLAVLELISQIASLANIINTDELTAGSAAVLGVSALVGCGVCIAFIIVLLGAGALAVRMTAPLLRDLNDGVVVSAVAGGVAGFIWGTVSVIFGVLTPMINPDFESPAAKLGGSLISGICGVICCLPVEILVGAVLAVIGGAIYYSLAVKK